MAQDEDLKQRLDIHRRLDILAELSNGWLDGDEGLSIPETTIEWVRDVLVRAEECGMPRPYLYPTFDGGLQAEWEFPGTDVCAKFDPEGRQVLCSTHHDFTLKIEEDLISLEDDAGLGRFVDFVVRWDL
jgi:hypothetical protein